MILRLSRHLSSTQTINIPAKIHKNMYGTQKFECYEDILWKQLGQRHVMHNYYLHSTRYCNTLVLTDQEIQNKTQLSLLCVTYCLYTSFVYSGSPFCSRTVSVHCAYCMHFESLNRIPECEVILQVIFSLHFVAK